MSLSTMAMAAVAAVLCIRFIIGWIRHARMMKHMPPGPPGLPLLGNILQLTDLPWYRYAEWKEAYGPIFSLNFAGQAVVILSEFSVTADITDRRSAIYSDRPRLIMAGEIMGQGMIFPVTRYGDLWRSMRKATHEDFNAHAVKKYQEMQQRHAYTLLATLLKTSDQWEDSITVSLASTLLCLIYGFRPEEAHQRKDIIHHLDDFVDRNATAGRPGAFLVDFFPIMQYIPRWLAPWKRYGEESYQKDSNFFLSLLREARDRTNNGLAGYSFSSGLSDVEKRGELKEIESAWLAGMMYMAGLETTATTLMVFALAMLHYPDTMKRAQQEIDRVVGSDRLPTFADREDLPYVQALIQEVLRWRPPAPLAIPKRCTEDNWYNGYFIPEGTMMIENVWAMNHDPKYFEDPESFRPERYLDRAGQLTDPISDTHGYSHASFGSGRRICVGKDLAMQSLFINVAVFLWGANISHGLDEKGNPIVPSATAMLDKGVVVRPPSFPCLFKSRSSHVQPVLERVLDDGYDA